MHRIGTKKSTKQAKNEIIEGNRILSACESVYHEIFVSRHETVRLNRECHGKITRLESSVSGLPLIGKSELQGPKEHIQAKYLKCCLLFPDRFVPNQRHTCICISIKLIQIDLFDVLAENMYMYTVSAPNIISTGHCTRMNLDT